LTLSLEELQTSLLSGAIKMQDVALVHLRQACTVDPGQLGDAGPLKRMVEGLLPEVC
jgi:hypothetical protein